MPFKVPPSPSTNIRVTTWMSFWWLALQARHKTAQFSNDFSVFTETLIASSPSRVFTDLYTRSKIILGSTGPNFKSSHNPYSLH
nr:hypothetical protein Iba_chr12fCG18170 [Ipomoea batatas]